MGGVIRHLRPPVDVDALVADAVAQGRVVRHVVAGQTKAATLEAFADALDFPGWFGGNLDALADLLDHLARHDDGEAELVVDGVLALQREDPFAAAQLNGVLGEVALAHPRFHVSVIER